ncbi:hypothetical protein L3Q82_025231 [Scortum barcoo]|uniref:Uncharacterized protein n=1 Tax=Scortum barcoo TaxID=214431 RepID=A0ACB8WRS5_9TELE|nr:hypothetical protein L3Q82_025231 [Scortum barcoo]
MKTMLVLSVKNWTQQFLQTQPAPTTPPSEKELDTTVSATTPAPTTPPSEKELDTTVSATTPAPTTPPSEKELDTTVSATTPAPTTPPSEKEFGTTVSVTTPSPTPQTSSEEKQLLLQTSQLVCSRNQLKVGVPLGGLLSSDMNAFSGHLAAPYCSSYKMLDNTLWYEVPRRAGFCGNVLRTNNTHAIYSNLLFFYPPSNGSFVLPEIIPFSCAYPLETNTSIEACVKLPHGLSGSGTKATAYMHLYRDSNYTNIYPGGEVTLKMGSALHVEVVVAESDPSFAVVLQDCYTTRTSNHDDPMRYYLVHYRCPTDPQRVSVVQNGLSLRARFSAQLFPVNGDYPCTYLHCSVKLCNKRSENCVPTCRRRSYRSAPNSAELTPLTIGPINCEYTIQSVLHLMFQYCDLYGNYNHVSFLSLADL